MEKHRIILEHPSHGSRKLLVIESSPETDPVKWVVLKSNAASKELFEAAEYYEPKPDINKYSPHWRLTIQPRVKLTKLNT